MVIHTVRENGVKTVRSYDVRFSISIHTHTHTDMYIQVSPHRNWSQTRRVISPLTSLTDTDYDIYKDLLVTRKRAHAYIITYIYILRYCCTVSHYGCNIHVPRRNILQLTLREFRCSIIYHIYTCFVVSVCHCISSPYTHICHYSYHDMYKRITADSSGRKVETSYLSPS